MVTDSLLLHVAVPVVMGSAPSITDFYLHRVSTVGLMRMRNRNSATTRLPQLHNVYLVWPLQSQITHQ